MTAPAPAPEPVPVWAAELLARQTAMEAEWHELRSLLLARALPRGPSDEHAIARLLAELFRIIGREPFACWSVLDHASLPAGEDLRAALAALGLNARKLGKLLARIEGRDCDGFCVTRVAATRDGVLWRVAAVR